MVDKISYYDIKLNSPHKDTIVIKGNENECDSILFNGTVKLSLNSNVHFKKIKLALVGEASINYFARDEHGNIQEQIIEKYTTLKVDWNNLLVDDQGQIILGQYGDKPVKSYKMKKYHGPSTQLTTRPGFNRTKSTTFIDESPQSSIKLPQSGVDGTPFKNHPSHHSFLLPKGNYSLPFTVVLPSNICETVEGLLIGKMLYRFESSIQKGLFEKPIIKYKYIRVIRTLHPTSLSLTDNIDINNTWPQKVDYRVVLHKKGIAFGSKVPIQVVIVPLIKGLQIKQITCEIVQHHHVCTLENSSPEFEYVVGTQQILGRTELTSDYWDLTCYYKVPDNLKDLTQTCRLNHDFIRVKHRLRIIIQIKNPDRKISELRANLPVTLYISSNIGHVYSSHAEIDSSGLINFNKNKDDAIFKKDKVVSNNGTPLVSPTGSTTNLLDPKYSQGIGVTNEEDELYEEGEGEEDELDKTDAPPLYQEALHDKLFDISSPKSPIEQLGGYFDIAKAPEKRSSPLDVNFLSRVPSYNEALDEEDQRFDLSPSYEYGGISANLDDVSKLQSYGSLPNINSSLSRSFGSGIGVNHNRSKSSFKLQLPPKKK